MTYAGESLDRLRQFLLLIAIESAPAWLTTKGVLADWLDDQGDGERAQKVRVVDFSLDAFAKAMFDDFQRFAHTSAPTWEYARNAASFVCDRDMRRRVLGLFPGVWLTVDALVAFDAKTAFPAIQTGFVNALLAAGFVYNNAARDAFSWSALPADGGIPAPKEDVSWNMWQGARDGDKTRFVQRIHAPDLVPPEPQRNRRQEVDGFVRLEMARGRISGRTYDASPGYVSAAELAAMQQDIRELIPAGTLVYRPRCAHCAHEWNITDRACICPVCGAAPATAPPILGHTIPASRQGWIDQTLMRRINCPSCGQSGRVASAGQSVCDSCYGTIHTHFR